MSTATPRDPSTTDDWRDAAACRGVDPELFFPTATSGPALAEQEAAATAMCRRCPVLARCREWAVAHLAHGIAGGLTEDQRRDLRTREVAERKCPLPVEAARRGRIDAGLAELRCGRTPAAVAREFGVSERTAQRWAARLAHTPADGSPVAAGAPVLISHSNTRQGPQWKDTEGR